MSELLIDRSRKRYLTVSSNAVQIMSPLPTGLAVADDDTGYIRLHEQQITSALRAQDIQRYFLIGLHTSLTAETRPFVHLLGKQYWITRLGEQISTELERPYADDLCACVDVIGQTYLDTLQESTTLFDFWDYPPIEHPSLSGVALLAIAEWLWPLMRQFANEFNYGSGSSEWHVFDVHAGPAGRIGIRHTNWCLSASFRPISDDLYVPNGYICLIYETPANLDLFEEHTQIPWKEHIGAKGFWTASYAEQWLVDRFIPKVLSYYRPLPFLFTQNMRERVVGWIAPEMLACYVDHHHRGASLVQRKRYTHRVALSSITNVEQFATYLTEIQQWLNTYPVKQLPSMLFHEYYQVLADVAHHINPASLHLEGLRDYVRGYPSEDGEHEREEETTSVSYAWVLRCLNHHAERIKRNDYETSQQADFLSRVFLTLVRDSEPSCDQALITALKQGIAPLWEKCRFERRYCIQHGRE